MRCRIWGYDELETMSILEYKSFTSSATDKL